MEKTTPWTIRSKEFDDWGLIRNADGWPVAHALAGRRVNEQERDEHRRNGTDPYQETAELIVQAVNQHDALVDENRRLRERETVQEAALQTALNALLALGETQGVKYDWNADPECLTLKTSTAITEINSALAEKWRLPE